MQATYVGSRYFTWEKDGKVREGTNVYLVREFDEFEKGGAVGQCVMEEYVSQDFRAALEGLTPGELVLVSYTKGFKGKAIMSGITPLGDGDR